MRFFLSLLVVIGVLAAAAAGAAWWENRYFFQPGPASAQTVLVIAPKSGLARIAGSLQQAGAVDNALLFRFGVLRRGKATQLKAGEYAFPPHASEAQIMDMVVAHQVFEHRITVAEGLTSDAAVALVKAEPALAGPVPVVPEGSLLPETYLFERGTSRAELLARMHKAQETALAELWPKRKEGLPFASEEEALKLASIVEKETSIPVERPRIAAVFLNRIKRGMKLESDPTIIYGLTKGVPLGHALRQSELQTPNPYSTYQIERLPPTPICNPGRAAIEAVLNPPDTDELYFVADGKGGHVFAKTMADHQKNVAQWRKIQQEQNKTVAEPAPARLR